MADERSMNATENEHADVSVLICTWNRATRLHETLEWLARVSVPSGLRWEVVVIDNNSSDDTSAVVRSFMQSFPTTVHYVFEQRQGKSRAMNAGIRTASAPILAFADDDVRVYRGWLHAIVDAFRRHPEVGYCGGPVDPIWESPCPPWFAATGQMLWGTLAILDYGAEPFVFEERQRIPLGANFAIRRTLVDRIGDFNTRLGRNDVKSLLGQELPEFFARARAVGARGLYVPEMRVQHHVPASRLQPQYFRRWWYGKGISRARLEATHPVTELGLDLRKVATIGGVPRFLFGSALRDALRWMNALAHRNRGERFAAETQLCYFCGQLRERLRRTPSRA
jgi:glycosyltransferase involved in cell wall biosynthesis